MKVRQHSEQPEQVDEARYDRKTLERVMALAQRLQNGAEKSVTAAEMEALGVEVVCAPISSGRRWPNLPGAERDGPKSYPHC